jgi:hypothetical protein
LGGKSPDEGECIRDKRLTSVCIGRFAPVSLLCQVPMSMRNPFRFFVELMQRPVWIPIWVFYLMVANMASVGFWHEPLAKLIFITFMISAMLMMGLYSRFGFDKILGLGHIPWVPLLVYILARIPDVEGGFQSYLVVLAISIAISLAFDFVDVWKYFINRRST